MDIQQGVADRAAANRRQESALTPKTGIVVFSHLRWSFVWQRPQQFLSRFAVEHPVLFLEEPHFTLHEGDEPILSLETVQENVTVACVHLAPSWRGRPELGAVLREYAGRAIEAMDDPAFSRPLHWYYSPNEASWSLGWFVNSGIVYDCMDELSQFRGAPADLVENEAKLMDHADVIFTGGYELWRKKSRRHPNVHFFGCGVEFDHFSMAQSPTCQVPSDLSAIPGPRIGWFGVVDERVDYELVAEVARRRPEWSLVMVGPVVKVDPADLPQLPNLYWLGGRNYADLPRYAKGYDVCMMPFALNEATEYINPTKALEYLATGKPVVATPVADVVRQYSDIVEIVDGAEAFVKAVSDRLQMPNRAKILRGIELARASSWDSTVTQMRQLIADAIDLPAFAESQPVAAPRPYLA